MSCSVCTVLDVKIDFSQLLNPYTTTFLSYQLILITLTRVIVIQVKVKVNALANGQSSGKSQHLVDLTR